MRRRIWGSANRNTYSCVTGVMLLVPAWTPFRLWTGEWPDYFEMIEGLWWLNQPLITNKACTRISINAQHWILMQRGSNSRRPHKMPFLSATTRCWGCISHGLTRAPLRCPKVCKKMFPRHYTMSLDSVLQCCLHQIVTPPSRSCNRKGDSSDQATFSSLLFFHLKLDLDNWKSTS